MNHNLSLYPIPTMFEWLTSSLPSGLKPCFNRLSRAVFPAVMLLGTLLSDGGTWGQAHAQSVGEMPEQTATQWAPYLEWQVENPSHSGNPFDLVATVSFTHTVSRETRKTEMFYAGGVTWKWRFTGTRQGEWTFTSSSSDADLDGISGTVLVTPNPDSDVTGFLTSVGNRYAHMAGADGTDRKAYLLTVFMDGPGHEANLKHWPTGDLAEVEAHAESYMSAVRAHGSEAMFIQVNNAWFKLGAESYTEHSSENPDPYTFDVLETIIKVAHRRGGHLRLWAWGDERRKWTPVGVGGINGVQDRRLQRYIAARLGPLPGWSMNYGFDLHEWTTDAQMESWASYLHEHMGWPHLLGARGFKLTSTSPVFNAYAQGGRDDELDTNVRGGPHDYEAIVDDLNSDVLRPIGYEERSTYDRWSDEGDRHLTMERTRRLLWWAALAGGAGTFIGFYDPDEYSWVVWPYPNPEQLVTYRTFWHVNSRFDLGLERDNSITNGYALRSGTKDRFVFYIEDASVIDLNLSVASGPLSAIAVDTKQPYTEIELGMLGPKQQTLSLPRESDWAIAVGYGDAVER